MYYKKQQGGFTFIELVIALLIGGIITTFGIKSDYIKLIMERQEAQRSLAKKEIEQIRAAAGGYLVDQDEWPDFTNNCSNALTTLTTSSPVAYLNYINSSSSYSTPYITSCNTNTFTVQLTVDTNDNALRLSNVLANSTATATVVSAEIPRPEEQPALQQFLLLDGSRAMTGDLDLGNNAIANTSDIELDGQDLKLGIGKFISMGSDAFNSINAIISKPNCNQDSIVGIPKIILRIHGVTTTLGSTLGIRNVSWSASFNSINTTQWQLSTTGISAITGVAETFCDYGTWNR